MPTNVSPADAGSAAYRALFLLRGYNDIDHTVPVVSAVARSGGPVRPVCVVVNVDRSYAEDPRLAHLRALGVPVHHILDFFGLSRSFQRAHFEAVSRRDRGGARYALAPVLLRLSVTARRIRRLLRGFSPDAFLDWAGCHGPGDLAVFDYAAAPLSVAVAEAARRRDVTTVSLPHSVNVFRNLLVGVADVEPFPDRSRVPRLPYEHVVFPNDFFADKAARLGWVGPGQSLVIGSPRFCAEWTGTLRSLWPPVDLPPAPGELKVVFMLSKPHHSVFEAEVIRQIGLVSRIPGVRVAVKLHTRGQRIHAALPPDVLLAGDETPSTALIDWADLTLFSASSIILDALRRDRPVAFLRRTVANRLVFEDYFSSWQVDSRDDLRDLILDLKEGRRERTYSPAERDRCLADLVDGGDPDVLGRYVAFFEGLAGARPRAASGPGAASEHETPRGDLDRSGGR